MKILVFLTFGLLYSLTCSAQEKTELMQVTVLKKSVRLNQTQLKGLIHNGFDEKMAADFYEHTYKKNNLLLYYLYSAVSSPKFKRSLEFYQKMFVSLLSGHSELKGNSYVVDSSRIVTFNNIRFLVIEYHDKSVNYIKFTSDYDKNLQFINGFIEYKKPDEVDAQRYLREFLGSMHFKQ